MSFNFDRRFENRKNSFNCFLFIFIIWALFVGIVISSGSYIIFHFISKFW